MRRLYFILLICVAFVAQTYAQWTNLNAPTTDYQQLAVSADGKNIAVFDMVNRRNPHYVISHDFGNTWETLNPPNIGQLNSFTITLAAPVQMFWEGDEFFIHDQNPVSDIKSSSDFGKSYTFQSAVFGSTEKIIRWPNGKWNKYSQGFLSVSTDKGRSWQNAVLPIGTNYFVYYTTAANGNLVATSTSYVYYSTDNGQSWVASTFPAGDGWLNSETSSIGKLSDGTLILFSRVSFSKKIYQSTDNGVSWQLVNQALPIDAYFAQYDANDIIFLCTDGSTYRSSDKGITFNAITAPGAILSNATAMVSSGSGIYICGSSAVYKYNNNAVATETANPFLADNVSVYPNPCRDLIHLKSDRKLESCTVVNLSGEQVLKANVPGNTIDVHLLKAGVYLLRVKENANKQDIIRLVKE